MGSSIRVKDLLVELTSGRVLITPSGGIKYLCEPDLYDIGEKWWLKEKLKS